MEIKLEGLIVAIFAVLPGFVSAAVRAILKPTETSSAGEWVARSIVASISFNALTLLLFVLIDNRIDLREPVAGIERQFGSVSSVTVLWYLALLYLIAIVWGIVSGYASGRFAPRILAYQLRLTPISPSPNVFTAMFEQLVGTRENLRLRGDPRQEVPWIRVRREKCAIFGRLRRSSAVFQVNEPIEVFLDPAYLIEGSETAERIDEIICPEEYQHGLYLRLLQEDVVDVLVAPAEWNPLVSIPPEKPEMTVLVTGPIGD